MSALTWLDFSAEEQRRTREILRLFEEKESRDELGIGQVRDAFSDLLFPGTSVLLTRARYFLIVPWCSRYAESTSHLKRGRKTMDAVERIALVSLKEAAPPGETGIIGAVAGAAVKNLPSTIYANALETFGIDRPAVQDGVLAEEALGEHVTRQALGRWVSSLPPAPEGFPHTIPGGVSLTRVEAQWLYDQISAACPDTYLTHIMQSDWTVEGVVWAWEHPDLANASPDMRQLVKDAELFSLAMHGAALLYNLLIAERYEAAGLTQVDQPVERYCDELDAWEDAVRLQPERPGWDTAAMWQRVIRQNRRIQGNVRARLFIDDWLGAFVRGEAQGLADSERLRSAVRGREISVKGAQSRLTNPKLLTSWAGASGSQRLGFRWGNVARLVDDIHTGLEADDARA